VGEIGVIGHALPSLDVYAFVGTNRIGTSFLHRTVIPGDSELSPFHGRQPADAATELRHGMMLRSA
jgi:hypothetical protein